MTLRLIIPLQPATTFDVNSTKTGHVGYYYDLKRDSADWYKITTTQNGSIKLKLNPVNGSYLYVALYDVNGTTLLKTSHMNAPFSIEQDGLAAGTYYVKVYAYYTNGFSPYTIENIHTPIPANDIEPNNSVAQATELPVNDFRKGSVGYYHNNLRDAEDWYKITLNKNGLLKLKLELAGKGNVSLHLFDNNGTFQLNTTTGTNTFVLNTDGLAAGTYFIRIKPTATEGFTYYTLSDSLISPVEITDLEPNGSVAEARTIKLNGTITGHVGYYYNLRRDTTDWFKVLVPEHGAFRIKLSPSNGQYLYASLIDRNGTTVLKSTYTATPITFTYDGVAPGLYFIKVNAYYSYGYAPYTLTDSLLTTNYITDVEPNNSFSRALALKN
jgi:hypothetical protein